MNSLGFKNPVTKLSENIFLTKKIWWRNFLENWNSKIIFEKNDLEFSLKSENKTFINCVRTYF
jgi:hypothetical protein